MTDPRTAMLFRLPSDDEFVLFRDLVLRETGIFLADTKKNLLAGRLMRRLRDLDLSSFRAYYQRVVENEAERLRMLDAISTNETHFFREPRHFELLERTLAPEWARELAAGTRRQVRIWSAGCSSGEEPYSVAMSLLDSLGPSAPFTILATDLSTRMLARAQEAHYPLSKLSEIPGEYQSRYMLKGVRSREGLMKPAPEVRANVEFRRVNFNDDQYDVDGKFDLILCRNVLIYFQPDTKAKVVAKLLRHLDEGGLLLVGHAETLTGMPSLRSMQPTVYRRTA